MSLAFPQQIENSISYWKYICHIQNFFMDHSFGDPNLGVTWSLAIEEQFYLILPLLIRISRRTIKYIIVAGIIMAPVIRYLLGGNAAYVLLPARIDSLFFGVGIAYLFVTDQLNWFLNKTKLLLVFELLLLILMAILSITTDWNRTGGVWNHSIYAIFYSIIILLALQEKGSVLQNFFNSPLLIYLGKVSYGLYLIHVPVLTVVFYLFTRESPGLGGALDLLLVIMSFAICLFLLEISYRFYETPMRNLGRKFSY
jgi:peptidoglycan/LPS O-acetylase OafA/YrhL